MSLTRNELQLVLHGLELLQNAFEADIDDCTHADGYEDSDACRRAEICLAQTQELIAKVRVLTATQPRKLSSCALITQGAD